MNPEPELAQGFRTGLARSILGEIAEHLTVLADTGQTAAIDLRSLPMTAADRAELEEVLGHGEVEVALDVAGTSEAWETSYAGVWWVRHYGDGERIASERIEIAPLPEILAAHHADIVAAASRLRGDLTKMAPAGEELVHVQ